MKLEPFTIQFNSHTTPPYVQIKPIIFCKIFREANNVCPHWPDQFWPFSSCASSYWSFWYLRRSFIGLISSTPAVTSNWPSHWSNTCRKHSWIIEEKAQTAGALATFYLTSLADGWVYCKWWSMPTIMVNIAGLPIVTLAGRIIAFYSSYRWLGIDFRRSHQIRSWTVLCDVRRAIHDSTLYIV